MAGMKPAKHGRDHCRGGEDPIPCLNIFPWAILRDGSIEHAGSGGNVQGGFEVATKNDPSGAYFEFVSTGAPAFFELKLLQEGIYLIDSVGTWDSWGTGTGTARYELAPTNDYDPYGLGLESATWVLSHEWGTDSPWMRISGIMSANANCTIHTYADQTTGTTKFIGLNYIKAVYLQSHGPTADWTVDTTP